MASITIRNLDDKLKAQLRIRAAQRGKSMEDEAREILRRALSVQTTAPGNLANAIRKRFTLIGGVDLPLHARELIHEPPNIDS